MEKYNPRKNWKLIKWKIYYTDGSTTDSNESTWKKAKQKEVCCIKKVYDNGVKHVEIEMGSTLYHLNDDDLTKFKIPTNIKIGGWIDTETHLSIYNSARKEGIDF